MNTKCTTPIARLTQFSIATVILLAGSYARASFHDWRINEIYSNHSGTVQFVEFTSATSGQEFLVNQTLISTQGSTSRTFTFPTNLAAGTANRKFLIATPAFAALGIVTPDFTMPEGFLFTANATINFANGRLLKLTKKQMCHGVTEARRR